jgi:hypothetical protein
MVSVGNLRRNGNVAAMVALAFALPLLAFESAHLAASSLGQLAQDSSSQPAAAQEAGAATASAASKVQAAIDERCDGIHPGEVSLPSGILHLDAPLRIPSECSVSGDASLETTLRATENFAPRAPDALVSIATKKDVVIQNVTLDGNHPANKNNFDLLQINGAASIAVHHVHGRNSANGITVLNASNHVSISDSEIERCGLPLPSASGSGVGISPGVSAISGVSVIRSRIHDNNQGIALFNSDIPGKNVTDVLFAHNFVYSNADDGINVTSGGRPTGGSIVGLHVEDNETYCNGWTTDPRGGPGGLGFPPNCKPGFFQHGPESSSGVGIDIIGPLTVNAVVRDNRTHDNLFDGISNDGSLMVTVSAKGKTVHRLSGPPFNPQWKPGQSVIINGTHYHIESLDQTGSTLVVSASVPATASALLYGPTVVGNSFLRNISINNATGLYNQMADGNSYGGNVAIHNALSGLIVNGGSFNTYRNDRASQNAQNHAKSNQGFTVDEGIGNRFIGIQADDNAARPTQIYGIGISAGARDTLVESGRLSGAGDGAPIHNLANSTIVRTASSSATTP